MVMVTQGYIASKWYATKPIAFVFSAKVDQHQKCSNCLTLSAYAVKGPYVRACRALVRTALGESGQSRFPRRKRGGKCRGRGCVHSTPPVRSRGSRLQVNVSWSGRNHVCIHLVHIFPSSVPTYAVTSKAAATYMTHKTGPSAVVEQTTPRTFRWFVNESFDTVGRERHLMQTTTDVLSLHLSRYHGIAQDCPQRCLALFLDQSKDHRQDPQVYNIYVLLIKGMYPSIRDTGYTLSLEHTEGCRHSAHCLLLL